MSTRTSSDIFTNLSTLLPTGTFLTFQSLAPLFTNNGECGRPEKIVTGILLGIFFLLCFGLSFVDSITIDTGKVYYGLVTPGGLFNPQFKTLKLPQDYKHDDNYFTGGPDYVEKYGDQYKLKLADFVNGVLNVITFGALSLLTPPISTCYYPGIPTTVVKTGPILAALVVGGLFAMFPSGRNGLGYTKTAEGVGLVHTVPADDAKPPADAGTGAPTPAPTNNAGSGNTGAKGADQPTLHELDTVV